MRVLSSEHAAVLKSVVRDAQEVLRSKGVSVRLVAMPYSEYVMLTPEVVTDVVAKALNIKDGAVFGTNGDTKIVFARYICIDLLLHHFPGLGVVRIGKMFGYADHTTVVYARKKVQRLFDDRDAVFITQYMTAQKAVEQWIKG